MCVTKKSSSRVIFFAVSRVSPSHAFTAKKKKLHGLPQKKKITSVTIFLLHAFTAKKNYTYRNKRITRCDDCFLHTFTAKIKRLHDLTPKKELPILLKMHACRQCAHLWATSDHGGRSWSGPDPKKGGGGLYGPRDCYTEQCALSEPPRGSVSAPGARQAYFLSRAPPDLVGHLCFCPPALKRWGPPRRPGLCSHLAHLWATSDAAPRSEAVGSTQAVGVM